MYDRHPKMDVRIHVGQRAVGQRAVGQHAVICGDGTIYGSRSDLQWFSAVIDQLYIYLSVKSSIDLCFRPCTSDPNHFTPLLMAVHSAFYQFNSLPWQQWWQVRYINNFFLLFIPQEFLYGKNWSDTSSCDRTFFAEPNALPNVKLVLNAGLYDGS